MKRKLYIMITLMLLPLLTTAARDTVRVSEPCAANTAFTIRIPVRFPENMTVQYAWYCNDSLIEDSHKLLLGEKAIAYTIPANSRYSGDVAFHFKYRLDDEYYEWTRSPVYVVSFEAWNGDCRLNGGAIESAGYVECGLDGGIIESLGVWGCNLYAGIIGEVSVPDFSPCELTAGSVESAGYVECGLDSGVIESLGLGDCSLNAGEIGD